MAVRTDSMNSVKEGTEALYPALRFVVDEGDEIRRSLRMGTSGLRGGDRHTYLVEPYSVKGCVASSQGAPHWS